MKNIERALLKYLNEDGKTIKDEKIANYAQKHGNELLNILFNLLEEKLTRVKNKHTKENIDEIVYYIELVLNNTRFLDKELLKGNLIIIKELLLDIKDYEYLITKLDSLMKDEIEEQDVEDFLDYIIKDQKNFSCIEYLIKRYPQIINIKSKSGNTLFQDVIKKLLKEDNEDNELYYINLLMYLTQQEGFKLTSSSRRKILETLYNILQKLKCNKKIAKQNKRKIEYIYVIIDLVKEDYKEISDIETLAELYDVPILFNKDIKEEVSEIKQVNTTNYPLHKEVVNEYIVSIDEKDVNEIDDCLSCKKLSNGNYLLGVHTASVLGYFKYDSDIIREAFKRGNSIYLPKEGNDDLDMSVIPLFPIEFSKDKGSLLENEKRLARSFYFEIDKNGNILDRKFQKSIIINNKQLTYKEANKYVKEQNAPTSKLQETLNNLEDVGKILKKCKYNEVEDLISSENVVYMIMLLTGSEVARYFGENNYPCLLRVHETDEFEKERLAKELGSVLEKETSDKITIINEVIDKYNPASYYDMYGGHDGLNLDKYCQCTSCLRRAVDILAEHTLEVCYDKTPTDDELSELKEEIEEKRDLFNQKSKTKNWFKTAYVLVKKKRKNN